MDWRTQAGALLLGAVAAAILSTALAQELGLPRLRGLAESQPTQPLRTLAPQDPLGDPAQATPQTGAGQAPPATTRGNQRRLRRGPTRRTRAAAFAQVRSNVHAPTVSAAVAPDPQPLLTGLPDPVVPLVAQRRRRPIEDDLARQLATRFGEVTSFPRPNDPYGQLGIRSGPITYFPSLQQNFGYDSNPNRVSGAHHGSIVSRTDGELAVQSDWPVHELTGFLRGSYSAYPSATEANRPEGEGRVALRIDASRDLRFDVEAHGRLETQRPGSPELNASVVERPSVESFGTSIGATQRFNRLSVALRGSVDRFVFEDARLTSGTILDQSDRNNNQYALRLRAGYELKPGLAPFAEATADTRVYDQRIDNAGFRRDSDGVTVRAGSTFEITRLITGEASAGLQSRQYDDPRLKDLRGPIVDASLIWVPTPLTTVRLRASSTLFETTIPNASGAVARNATLEVQHDFRRNFSVVGLLGFGETDYRGVFLKEQTFTGSLRAEYKLTRAVVLRASFTHERLKSTSPGSDYSANTYLVGVRFQP